MRGSVEEYLLKSLKSGRAIHLTLLDPEKLDAENASEISRIVQSAGSSGIMVGGSTSTSVYHLDNVVKAVKKNVDIPVILFPNDVTGISQYADAVFFMSLMNSSNPYYITDGMGWFGLTKNVEKMLEFEIEEERREPSSVPFLMNLELLRRNISLIKKEMT